METFGQKTALSESRPRRFCDRVLAGRRLTRGHGPGQEPEIVFTRDNIFQYFPLRGVAGAGPALNTIKFFETRRQKMREASSLLPARPRPPPVLIEMKINNCY